MKFNQTGSKCSCCMSKGSYFCEPVRLNINENKVFFSYKKTSLIYDGILNEIKWFNLLKDSDIKFIKNQHFNKRCTLIAWLLMFLTVFNSDDPKAILIKQSEKLRDLIKKLETQNNKLREFSEKSQKFNSLSEDMSSSSSKCFFL